MNFMLSNLEYEKCKYFSRDRERERKGERNGKIKPVFMFHLHFYALHCSLTWRNCKLGRKERDM